MTKGFIGAFSAVFALGMAAGCLSLQTYERRTAKELKQIPLKVRLYRFQLNTDRLDVFDQWVAFERAHHAETIQTLEGEKIYFEAVMRDREHRPTDLYWIAVSGQSESDSETPAYPIDAEYKDFEAKILVKGTRQEISPDYVLTPGFINLAIDQHESKP